MKRGISQNTYALLGELRERSGMFAWTTTRTSTLVRLIQQVGSAGETASLFHLFPLVTSRNAEVSRAAIDVVVALLRSVPVQQLPWLEALARHGWEYGGSWYGLGPDGLTRLQGRGSDSAILLGLATLHGNGFVRERAIRYLGNADDVVALPFILLRLNDWVANVRAAALQALENWLHPQFAVDFVTALPLVLRLESATRVDQSVPLQKIKGLLRTGPGLIALRGVLDLADPEWRRFAYRQLAEAAPSDLTHLISKALADSDLVVRRWAAHQIEHVPPDDRRGLLLRALSDPNGGIRAMALESFVAFPHEAHSRMIDALLDKSRPVRATAQTWLRRNTDFQLLPFYKEHLVADSSVSLRAALHGVSETGSEVDAPILLPFLTDKRAGVRRSAVDALSKIGAGKYPGYLARAVLDGAAAVSRRATIALARRTHLLNATWLDRELAGSHPFHVRQNLLNLLASFSKWERIYYVLCATSDDDGRIARMALSHINRWLHTFNKSFLTPNPEQLERARTALERQRFVLDKNTFREVEFSMRGF
jgi:HEAT repeat protein